MKKIKPSDIPIIMQMYDNNETTLDIAKKFGYKTNKTIREILIKEGYNLNLRKGYNSRRCKINETFFDVIDTPNKAYILGWIISDGYVNKYKLIFNLKDLDILEIIKDTLGSTHKITHTKSFDKRTNKIYKGYSLQICSKKIIVALNNLGIQQSKSFTVDLPTIDESLYPHLIRGIFDGDGYVGIGVRENGQLIPRFSMIVSENLYKNLEPIFNEMGINYKTPELIAEKNGDKILKIRAYKKEELKKFFNFIYPDNSIIKLERKYVKVKKLFPD